MYVLIVIYTIYIWVLLVFTLNLYGFYCCYIDTAENNQPVSATATDEAHSIGAVFKQCWGYVMSFFLIAFFVSCFSHFAQYYQMTLDQDDSNKLRKRLPHSVRLELQSPTSGRLKLPPPTPLTVAYAKTKETERETGSAPPSMSKLPATFLFPKTPSAYPKTPKTQKTPGYVLREVQLSGDNNPGTPEVTTRKRE